MNRLAALIHKLDVRDLLLVQKDLDSGNIEKLIAGKLAQEREKHGKTCPVCGAVIAPSSALKLEFGPPDLRKRAYFDAPDCLTWFVSEQKVI